MKRSNIDSLQTYHARTTENAAALKHTPRPSVSKSIVTTISSTHSQTSSWCAAKAIPETERRRSVHFLSQIYLAEGRLPSWGEGASLAANRLLVVAGGWPKNVVRRIPGTARRPPLRLVGFRGRSATRRLYHQIAFKMGGRERQGRPRAGPCQPQRKGDDLLNWVKMVFLLFALGRDRRRLSFINHWSDRTKCLHS